MTAWTAPELPPDDTSDEPDELTDGADPVFDTPFAREPAAAPVPPRTRRTPRPTPRPSSARGPRATSRTRSRTAGFAEALARAEDPSSSPVGDIDEPLLSTAPPLPETPLPGAEEAAAALAALQDEAPTLAPEPEPEPEPEPQTVAVMAPVVNVVEPVVPEPRRSSRSPLSPNATRSPDRAMAPIRPNRTGSPRRTSSSRSVPGHDLSAGVNRWYPWSRRSPPPPPLPSPNRNRRPSRPRPMPTVRRPTPGCPLRRSRLSSWQPSHPPLRTRRSSTARTRSPNRRSFPAVPLSGSPRDGPGAVRHAIARGLGARRGRPAPRRAVPARRARKPSTMVPVMRPPVDLPPSPPRSSRRKPRLHRHGHGVRDRRP